jgi:hypothetical protein
MSQSLYLHSLTLWSPVARDVQLSTEAWGILHAQTENVLRVVENLTPSQKKLLSDSSDPNLFYPHVGIFSKDFFIATVLLKSKS